MIINEDEMLATLNNAKNVLLIEPNYHRKYPPMGLMKISTYLKKRGIRVRYERNYIPGAYDLICITSLFTFNSKEVIEDIEDIQGGLFPAPIMLGGVLATLMKGYFDKNYPNIKVFAGYSKVLDVCYPDYDIGYEIPWYTDDISHIFTSRGCPNNCAYCAVKQMEGDSWIIPEWQTLLNDNWHKVMLYDNNFSSLPFEHQKNVCEYLINNNKEVIIQSGFDCKFIDEQKAELYGRLTFVHGGCRTAFDRIEEDGVFQHAISLLRKNQIAKNNIVVYALINFKETPAQALYRLRELVRMDVRPYPQLYEPLNKLIRDNPFYDKAHGWNEAIAKTIRHFFLLPNMYKRHDFFDWIREMGAERPPASLLTEDDIELMQMKPEMPIRKAM